MKPAKTIDIQSKRPEQLSDPCVMVIFGASGDLTKRKLIPALYNLAKEEYLPRHFALVGIARSAMSSEQFRNKITPTINGLYATDLVDTPSRQLIHRLPY